MREIKFRAWNKQARKMFNIQKALFGAHGGSCFRVEGIWFPETKLGVVTREDVLNNPTIMPEIATMNVCDDPCGEKTEHCVLMQYTGLKDRNGLQEVYEGDIIDEYGNIKGNIYKMDKGKTDFVIQGFGTKDWCETYRRAILLGCKDAE